jgi:hypothetical protein
LIEETDKRTGKRYKYGHKHGYKNGYSSRVFHVSLPRTAYTFPGSDGNTPALSSPKTINSALGFYPMPLLANKSPKQEAPSRSSSRASLHSEAHYGFGFDRRRGHEIS